MTASAKRQQDVIPPAPGVSEWHFIEELKMPRPLGVTWRDNGHAPRSGELDLRGGIDFCGGFPDLNGRLLTAEDSMRRFLCATDLARPDGVPFVTVLDTELPREAFLLQISKNGLRLEAGDCEGIRRGLYHFEDLLAGAEGPCLEIGTIDRRFWVKNRISRCFFGPIKRAPLHRDELMDDEEYYPDAYLDRLAHEGINGLWLTVELRDLIHTSMTLDVPNGERRMAKLRRTVDQCLRYGIKTWVFCIEPLYFKPDDPLLKRYPELRGAPTGNGGYCFCPSSKTADRYLYEALNGLFASVPGLGGMINLSHGERPTTCLSSLHSHEEPVNCPRCRSLVPWQIVHRSLQTMHRGMRDANPDAELISWFYTPHAAPHADWMFDLAGHLPEGVILQYNFESGVIRNQLGHPRVGGDYWLSEVGPSQNFSRVAERAAHAGTPVSAKLQVGCSHEVATFPFVPVPGLLYRKYRQMRRLGCAHAMQCWYFGNYPGLMNRAAGLLAGETFEDGEEAFLRRLARPDWGDATETVVQAWQRLAEGYAQYPLENMIGYYGPMHDGIVWPMLLQPALAPLAPTWLAANYPSGDTVGECLGGFTLPEALGLFEQICSAWDEGTALLLALRPRFRDNPARLRDIDLVEALQLSFRSGRNLFRFYYLRFLLMSGRRKDPAVWDELQRLLEEEKRHSQRMLELCANDPRLGFHSESETYKFYPAKLQWRIHQVETVLESELPAVRRAFEACEPVFDGPLDLPTYRCGQGWMSGEAFRWRFEHEGDDLVFYAECQAPERRDYTIIDLYLLDRAGIVSPRRFRVSPEISASDSAIINISWGEMHIDVISPISWNVVIHIPGLSWQGDPALRPAYVGVIFSNIVEGEAPAVEQWPPLKAPRLSRLALGTFDPRALAHLEIV